MLFIFKIQSLKKKNITINKYNENKISQKLICLKKKKNSTNFSIFSIPLVSFTLKMRTTFRIVKVLVISLRFEEPSDASASFTTVFTKSSPNGCNSGGVNANYHNLDECERYCGWKGRDTEDRYPFHSYRSHCRLPISQTIADWYGGIKIR